MIGFLFAIIILTGQSNMVLSADAIAARMPGYTVVDCSVGGSSVTRWQRGDLIYDRCVAAVRAEIVRGGVVVGIMHFQGERDTYSTVAFRWKTLTLRFFRDIRRDIGAPAIPIVYAQIGKKPTDKPRPYWYRIQRSATELQIGHPNLYMITTSDLEPHCPSGGVHWCPEVYPKIAGRFVTMFYREASLPWMRDLLLGIAPDVR